MPTTETVGGPTDPPWTRCASAACPAPTHDTFSGYAYGCRSDAAKRARRRYLKLRSIGRQDRLRPSWPTTRRLRALAAAGWSWPLIAEHANCNWRVLSRIASGHQPSVRSWVALAVERAYEELAHAPGPDARARTWALRREWRTPGQWVGREIDDPDAEPVFVPDAFDDDIEIVKVERAKSWQMPLSELTVPEQNAVVAALSDRYTAAEIADRAQTTQRQIERVKARLRDAARRAQQRSEAA